MRNRASSTAGGGIASDHSSEARGDGEVRAGKDAGTGVKGSIGDSAEIAIPALAKRTMPRDGAEGECGRSGETERGWGHGWELCLRACGLAGEAHAGGVGPGCTAAVADEGIFRVGETVASAVPAATSASNSATAAARSGGRRASEQVSRGWRRPASGVWDAVAPGRCKVAEVEERRRGLG